MFSEYGDHFMNATRMIISVFLILFVLFSLSIAIKLLFGWWEGDWRSPLTTAATITTILTLLCARRVPADKQ